MGERPELFRLGERSQLCERQAASSQHSSLLCERHAVDALLERLVREARVPGRAARESLRRELAAHFEDAGGSADALRQAVARFGGEDAIATHFRRVYRRDYALLYLIKIAAAVLLSAAAALALQVLVNLRVAIGAEALRLAPGFSKAAIVSLAVVLALATAWEMGRPPFDRRRASIAIGTYVAIGLIVQALVPTGWQAFAPATALVIVGYACSRLGRAPARLLLTFCGFAALMFAGHASANVEFSARHTLLASAALLAIWTSTVTILSRCDDAFLNVFDRA